MRLLYSVLTAAAAAATSVSAVAVSFDVSQLVPKIVSGNDWNTIGPGLYKADSGNPVKEDGSVNLFNTVFNAPVSGDILGGIVYFSVPGSQIDVDSFVVKSGNEFALYDLSFVTDWSKYDSISFKAFASSSSSGSSSTTTTSSTTSSTPPATTGNSTKNVKSTPAPKETEKEKEKEKAPETPKFRNISHVSIYGANIPTPTTGGGDPIRVSDEGWTLTLLGAGILAIGLKNRR